MGLHQNSVTPPKPITDWITAIDKGNLALSKALSWLPLGMAMLTGLVVALRYGWGIGFIAAQEGVMYLHSALFMLGASCALRADEHVRVDIFYRNWPLRGKTWINGLGQLLFTLPVCGLVVVSSIDYVAEAWSSLEVSPEPGGLPAVFLLKTLIPLMAITLAIQSLAELARALIDLLSTNSEHQHHG